MIQFSKLRLNGFKSFLDSTELDIRVGLTGIVGPNGCGKSNLVEALRWVMGESSAKKMRGEGMEDVIFNGTSSRPARNLAEVSILLDNTDRRAPAPYNNADEIEITRKIKRDQGSAYKINGKNARARDVQLLFADTMSGANSPALVSQGHVSAMIQAKPKDRRLVLEESAGISGLYARRHEAELRLRAADNNLVRLEDIVGSMETRLSSLKRQVRQATRYRNVSAKIKETESFLSWLEWKIAKTQFDTAERLFSQAEKIVAERMGVVSHLTVQQTEEAKDLPALRNKEAQTAAAWQAQNIALQRLEDESNLIEKQITECRELLSQTTSDRQHELETAEESVTSLEKLKVEEEELHKNRENEEEEIESLSTLKKEKEEDTKAIEKTHQGLLEEIAHFRAEKKAAEKLLHNSQSKQNTLKSKIETLIINLSSKKEELKQVSPVETLQKEISVLEEDDLRLEKDYGLSEALLRDLAQKKELAQETLQTCKNHESKISSEIKALESVIQSFYEGNFRPVLEQIQTDSGFEVALSKAFGDTLSASTDTNALVFWEDRSSSSEISDWPEGVAPLKNHIRVPKELQKALDFIGYVEDYDSGKNNAARLKPGQSIVSKEGAYWRWDGLHIKAEAKDRHAEQLKQKNRLIELEALLPAAEEAVQKSTEITEKLNEKIRNEQQKSDTLRKQSRETQRTLIEKRKSLQKAIHDEADRQTQIAKLEETLSLHTADSAELEKEITKHEEALSRFDHDNMEKKEKALEAQQSLLYDSRQALHKAMASLEECKQKHKRAEARIHAIADERLSIRNRSIRAKEQLKKLDEREKQTAEKLEELLPRPEKIRAERETILSALGELESRRNNASDRLTKAEKKLSETNKALKSAENELTESREERASSQATLNSTRSQIESIRQSIESRFECTAETLQQSIKIDQQEPLPSVEDIRRKYDKLLRERDNIGPVNLQAETEANELEKELTTLLQERNDLIEAIDELRKGIRKLNKEARERLLIAFDHVNAHFKTLFARLFKGGKAHLELVDSDDPLEAGLEIFAQPPGKSLQSLSLLSGGEQTLASISLVFAMFLTNPSPICVLDEIDAPLDDANVDRVCDLLGEIAEQAQTRFLVITHHRLTMARMNRLYGVTMAEKGVSKLVSVDLQQSFEFAEAA